MIEEIIEKAEEIITLIEDNPNDDLFILDELAHQLLDEAQNLSTED